MINVKQNLANQRPSLGGVMVLCLACAIVGRSQSVSEALGFEWRVESKEYATLYEGGSEVLRYQLGPRAKDGGLPRSNYVHPLRDLSGDIITEDFPEDHYHHRGVFWAWHQLLLNGKSIADPWNCEKIRWLPPEDDGDWFQTSTNENRASMVVRHDWAVPLPLVEGLERRVVRETMKVVVWRAVQGRRVIDFDLSLLAMIDGIAIGGSDDDKGYGGFSPRIRLAEDVRFMSQRGPLSPERTAIEGGAWVDVTGTFNGRKSGVAMMVHRDHPGFPLRWILRSKRSMQNPQWPGRKPIQLSRKHATRLQYRLVLHEGDISSELLTAVWKEFSR